MGDVVALGRADTVLLAVPVTEGDSVPLLLTVVLDVLDGDDELALVSVGLGVTDGDSDPLAVPEDEEVREPVALTDTVPVTVAVWLGDWLPVPDTVGLGEVEGDREPELVTVPLIVPELDGLNDGDTVPLVVADVVDELLPVAEHVLEPLPVADDV